MVETRLLRGVIQILLIGFSHLAGVNQKMLNENLTDKATPSSWGKGNDRDGKGGWKGAGKGFY